jgi:hypothetical protein
MMAQSTKPLSDLKDGVFSVCSASDNPVPQPWHDYRAVQNATLSYRDTEPRSLLCRAAAVAYGSNACKWAILAS